jgi:hypothetical protein
MDQAEAQVDSHSPTISRANGMGSPSVSRFALRTGKPRSPALMTTMLTSPTTGTLNPAVVPQRADPWTKIISDLSGGKGCKTARRSPRAVAARPYHASKKVRQAGSVKNEHGQPLLNKNVRVSFVERFGAKTVSLTWHDSTEACYGEQPWTLKIARSSGHCALTGMVVRRGDAVYSPASRAATRPLNCTQMILSAALERLEV